MTTRRRDGVTRRHADLPFRRFNTLMFGHRSGGDSTPTRDEAEGEYRRHRDRFLRRLERRPDHPPWAVLFFEPDLAPDADIDQIYPKRNHPIGVGRWVNASARLDELWQQEEPKDDRHPYPR